MLRTQTCRWRIVDFPFVFYPVGTLRPSGRKLRYKQLLDTSLDLPRLMTNEAQTATRQLVKTLLRNNTKYMESEIHWPLHNLLLLFLNENCNMTTLSMVNNIYFGNCGLIRQRGSGSGNNSNPRSNDSLFLNRLKNSSYDFYYLLSLSVSLHTQHTVYVCLRMLSE